jgi:hypothetical protein
MKLVALLLPILLLVLSSCEKKYTLHSPDQNIQVEFNILEGIPSYTLTIGDRIPIENSALGLKLDSAFSGKFKVIESNIVEVNNQYEMRWWKNRQITNHYNEFTISLAEIAEHPKALDIVFRAYDDGMAFRYVFPEQKHLDEFVIEEDLTESGKRTCFRIWVKALTSFSGNGAWRKAATIS